MNGVTNQEPNTVLILALDLFPIKKIGNWQIATDILIAIIEAHSQVLSWEF